MTAQGVFITGTDTGVGKTVVCAALLKLLRSAGMDAVPMKPVQTGATRRSGRWRSPDLEFCLAMADVKPGPVEYVRMAPCCYANACSPHLAATLTGRRIERRRVMSAFKALASRHTVVVAEGAGGVGVPLDRRHTMLDVMTWLGLPVVVVARPGLGTLNHTWLTLQALRLARIRVLGVVFNTTRPARNALPARNASRSGAGGHSDAGGPDRSDYIERDNIRTIAWLGAVRVLGRLPFIPNLATLSADQFRRVAAACLPPAATWLKWLQSP